MFLVKNNALQHNDSYVVGIGASAGGLEAINDLFDHVSDSDHVAFIVVQHLSSDYKSLLVELLAKHTYMPVEEARHKQPVEGGKVYVIPNNKELTIQNGLLMLAEKEFDKGPNTAIDTFFQSLARDQRQYAVSVLLSGTGTDGTRGIEAIKSYGGFVLVQDPKTAKFDGMPKSAIASGYADLVVPPADMFNQVCNYIDGVLPQETPQSKQHNECIQSILTTVYKRTGYDFIQYKQPTILRRIARRMQTVKIDGMNDYEQYVKKTEEEPALLAKEFFIGVTSFFRDKDAFTTLYREVILKLVESKEDYEQLKVWVTACSTGQEAYTVSILIDMAMQQLNKVLDVKIFATDIDKTSIETASRARYQYNQLLGLEKKVLKEYFTETEEGMSVIPRIRKQVVFATHDILKDPPFIRNDLVTCRNLLIYLNHPLQENVLATLNFALNPGGYLFLGTSENPSPLRRGFSEVDEKWKIYKRTSEQNAFSRRVTAGKSRSGPLPAPPVFKARTDVQLAEDFRKVMADKLGYTAIYVNENYEIKEALGNFRKYLSLPDKLSALHLLKMAPSELSGLLSTVLRKCQKENKPQELKHVKARISDQSRLIDIFVYPPGETTHGGYMLVVMADSIVDAEKAPIAVQDLSLLQKDLYVRQLEDELRETRTNLQMAVEGLETANEELQSSNEELQSANEELQSSNEELQSLNEELHTLNTEHQLRIKELVELNDDITNYLQSSLIGQVFLDRDLRIRRFNKAACTVINIIDSDIGRPIDHITHHIRSSTFQEDIRKANKTGAVIEREIELDSGAVYLIRILPYVRQDKMRDGLVITMVDVSATKNLNSIIKSVFDASAHPIFVFETDRREGQVNDFICTIANTAAFQALGKKPQEERLRLKHDFPELATPGLFKRYTDVVNSGKPGAMELNFTRNGARYWFQAGISKKQDGFVLVLTDITQRKESEEKLRKNYNELLVTKETLRELNDQLEQKIKERTRDLEISEERFRMVASLTNDVIWDWDFARNDLWWSDSYYELFAFNAADPDTRRHAFRLQHIHPEDQQLVKDAISSVLQGVAKEFDVAYRFRKADGEYAHVLDRGTLLLDDQGMPYRMIGAMVDVTPLEHSTQQLRQKNVEMQSLINQFQFVTNFMPQMVWATRTDGYVDFYNQQWYDYTGLSLEQSKGEGWLAALHPDDKVRTLELWKRSLQTGYPYEIEYRLKRSDDIYRWFLGRATPMRDDAGDIIKWFGTCTDIQDQKAAEKVLEDRIQERTRALRMLNKKLEDSNTDLMQFASVASHDLKEPLRKIHLFSGLIRDQFTGGKNNEHHLNAYIDRIINASSRATNLINDVLSYSRLSSENLFEQVDLGIILQEILQDLELVIQEKGARIHTGKLPVIEAVPGQMRQLFQNIIGNSLKFNKPGEAPVISVTARTDVVGHHPDLKDAGGQLIEITIRDEGIGFDEQYASKIFSLFQRLNSKEKYEGTGIGLAIAKKIVERHHGLIVAKGKEHEGAEFTIVLPVSQPHRPRVDEEVTRANQ
ncbi:chemotaxis protein CheB [uncultured Chitinophaga sp.]|jgi:PAS domain S-box|uniref:chemotaxis protein CheB n=1 Tax=uncultured Chitinophaga sp. TaxID=339340 RepID=UPI00260E47A7|nr:chemotaxis protein CheB [uncultured Chitinophaga sp.]